MFEANAVYRQKTRISCKMRRLEKRDALTYDILSVPAVSRSAATLRRQSV